MTWRFLVCKFRGMPKTIKLLNSLIDIENSLSVRKCEWVKWLMRSLCSGRNAGWNYKENRRTGIAKSGRWPYYEVAVLKGFLYISRDKVRFHRAKKGGRNNGVAVLTGWSYVSRGWLYYWSVIGIDMTWYVRLETTGPRFTTRHVINKRQNKTTWKLSNLISRGLYQIGFTLVICLTDFISSRIW